MKDRDVGIQLTPLEEGLRQLADLENPIPLSPEMVDVSTLKKQFAESGLNMEIGETEKKALARTKFRSWEKGKGATVALITGVEKVSILEAKLLELSAGGPRIISRRTGQAIVGSESRGLRQFTARLLAVSLGVITPEEFCEATNMAVWKGLRRGKNEEIKQRLAGIFSGTPEPESTTSSIPPGSTEKVYAFLKNGLRD